MKLVETIKNIFKIEELRKRILYTIGLILIYRFGSFVVIPGIDPNALSAMSAQTADGLMGLLDIFSGGAFSNASIFALGVMPYISASIIVQLLGIVVPYFQRLQREGESGHRKMNQITRYLTIAVLCLQGPAYLANLHAQAPGAFVMEYNAFFIFTALIVLIAGTMFVMWLGEKITDKGLGNGVSLIIMVGIVARLPHALLAELDARTNAATGGWVMLVVEFVLLYFICLLAFGTPLLLMELAVGRAGQSTLPGALRKLQNPASRFAWHRPSYVFFAGNMILLMFYVVVTGWLLDYAANFLLGRE